MYSRLARNLTFEHCQFLLAVLTLLLSYLAGPHAIFGAQCLDRLLAASMSSFAGARELHFGKNV